MNRLVYRFSLAALVILYLAAAGAPFLAPYSHKEQFREFFYLFPTKIHFRDQHGRWHLRPFIYDYEVEGLIPSYRESKRRLPIYFFVQGSSYSWFGFIFNTHLFGLRGPSKKIFLLGADGLGRDLFSRILYGSQFSLTIGVVGILITGSLGTLLGAVAGYFDRWADSVLMRSADLFLSLPGLFLILGIRAIFPLELSALHVYWVIILVFTLIGWASITRVVRGQVLHLKSQDYVLAARVAGASHWRILWKHILPFTSNYLVVQTSVFIPAYILGEVTLSFLGVGVQEPDASWGNLLTTATSVRAMTHYPWLLFPALFIFVTVLAFNIIGDRLKALEKPPTTLSGL